MVLSSLGMMVTTPRGGGGREGREGGRREGGREGGREGREGREGGREGDVEGWSFNIWQVLIFAF